MSVVVYTPIYNEMPWVPYFLKSLLEWDCPIVIAEGAADLIQEGSERSTDGSLELIRIFASSWKDRVSLYYHKPNKEAKTRYQTKLPRAKIKIGIVWDKMMRAGDWMVAVAPDNFYTRKDIYKLKEILLSIGESDEVCQLLTGTRVFNYSFKNQIVCSIPQVCGGWIKYWPCTYKKNNKWTLQVGDELLRHHKNKGNRLVGPSQIGPNYKNSHVRLEPDIINFHYKGVKLLQSRVKRLGKTGAKKWSNISPKSKSHKLYEGDHPSILDEHPWRHIDDCRSDQKGFNWREFIHLVSK